MDFFEKGSPISVLRYSFFTEMLIDLITGCAILFSWQHFGNRKTASINTVKNNKEHTKFGDFSIGGKVITHFENQGATHYDTET